MTVYNEFSTQAISIAAINIIIFKTLLILRYNVCAVKM